MPLLAVVAVLVGAVVLVRYSGSRRRGDDALGPRPDGDLPDTRTPLVIGVIAWFCAIGIAVDVASGWRLRRDGGPVADVVVSSGVNLLVALALLRAATRGTRRPTLPASRLAAIGVFSGFAMFTAQYVIGRAITTACALLEHAVPEQAIVEEARRASGGDVLVFALGAVVVAPFAEEVFFRGILLPAAARMVGVRAGLALQAIVFGLIHVQGAPETWPLAIPLALVGWCAGFVYLRTGSLAVPVLLHATFNALNFAALHAG